MKRLLALAPLPFLLVACGPPNDQPIGPATASVPSAAVVPLDPTLSPRPLPGSRSGPSTTLSPGQGEIVCGTFTLGQGEDFPQDAARCFVDAATAGRPVTLSVTRPTMEGDPIPVTYTAGDDGRVTVVTDSRQDGFGARNVTTATCQGPVITADGLDFTRCTEPRPVSS